MQKTVNETQEQYNTKMKQAKSKKTSFNVDDIVAIKIDKVDKTSDMSSLAKFFRLKITTT